ncbi:MAG: hypothetical protein WBB27_17220 [Maribacter sp.]
MRFLIWCCFVFNITAGQTQKNDLDNFFHKGGRFYSTGAEYVTSLDTDKDIEVYSFRLGYGSFPFKNISLQATLDLSGTTGYRKITMDNNTDIFNADSFAIGTSFLLRWYFLKLGSAALFLDIGAGILYGFKSFPPGGTKLNFTARPGGGLAIELDSKTKLVVGLNRFHLSNGQGYKHPFNPAFDGLGISVGLVFGMDK